MSGTRHALQVRVTYATGVVHTEGGTDDLAAAEEYARNAVLDYCPRAEVVAVAMAGYASGTVLAVWDERRLRSAPRKSDGLLRGA